MRDSNTPYNEGMNTPPVTVSLDRTGTPPARLRLDMDGHAVLLNVDQARQIAQTINEMAYEADRINAFAEKNIWAIRGLDTDDEVDLRDLRDLALCTPDGDIVAGREAVSARLHSDFEDRSWSNGYIARGVSPDGEVVEAEILLMNGPEGELNFNIELLRPREEWANDDDLQRWPNLQHTYNALCALDTHIAAH